MSKEIAPTMRLERNNRTKSHPAAGLLSLALAGLVTLGACGDSDDGRDQAALIKSRAAWTAARDAAQGDYIYEVLRTTFIGGVYTTRISIAHNLVTKRAYQAALGGAGMENPVATDWVETGVEVGTHLEGAPALTIDQLYNRCRDDVLAVNRSSNDITLLFRADGILDTCVYTPRGCQDDCATGVWVNTLEFLTESP
jgi:hypothetical protein